MAHFSLRLLGPFEASLDGEPLTTLRSDKGRALLAYLAVESDRPHRREKLAGMLWPDYTESSARANLRRALADLRTAIGDTARSAGGDIPPPYLLVSRDAIQFNAASDARLDVAHFATYLQDTHATDKGATQQLEEAIALYRGPFLDGFSTPDSPAFEEWALVTRERLHRLAMQALHRLASRYLEQGEYERALPHAWRQLELDPWRENAHRQIMRLLALSGQRDTALAQYKTCRRVLMEELGAEPSQQTQELYECLLNAEWPPPTPAETVARVGERRAVGECPYRGLAAFREPDAPFFFGREGFAARLVEAVNQQPPVAVIVGSSGSGKSSVTYAGLLPRLREEGGWLIAQFRPGSWPFQSLAAALLPLLEPEQSEIDQLVEAQKLAAALQCGDVALGPVVERILQRSQGQGRLLLVVDQFEELYTLCPEPDVQRCFVDGLLSAVDRSAERPESPLVLLITLRADFMGQVLAHRPLADALQDTALMLGPMTQEELQAAIEWPAGRQGAAFETGLVDRILEHVGEEPGNLPLLEFALTLLWEQAASGWLTHAAYEGIGRVNGALARYAEEVFNALERADQEQARRIFVQLVRPGTGTEDTRRVASRAEVGEANWPLTRHLADRRLVVTGSQAAGTETVEVAHEALIQNWGRLQGWLEADRAFRVWQEGLRGTLRQWEASERDEGALLRGAPLVQAESWLAEHEGDLGDGEREFIQTSVALRERREAEGEALRQRELASERRSRRLWGALAGVLAVATIVALSLTLFSVLQRRRAQEAYSLSLAANAREALDDLDTATGLVLSLAANRIEDPPREAQRVLMDAAYAPGARWRAEVAALFDGLDGPVTALAIGPDGERALAGLADGTIVLWNLATGDEIHRLPGHAGRVNDLTFGPVGRTALSGGDDARVIFWDLTTGAQLHRLSGHSGTVRSVDISPDGGQATSGGFAGESMMAPGELILWDLGTGEETRRLDGHSAGVVAVEFALDGNALLASSGDAAIFVDSLPGSPGEGGAPGLVVNDMILWNPETGEVIRRFDALHDDAYDLAVSPDGTKALIGSYYNNVSVLWDLESGERILTLQGHDEGIQAVAFSPDGQRAISGSYDDTLILWELSTGRPLARFDAHKGDVLDLAFSPDGRSALSSSGDGSLILWDLVDAAEVQRLAGHGDMVWDVAFTPDGRRALSSSGAASPSVLVQDASIRLWDLETAAETDSSGLPVDAIMQVAVSPDGSTALVASNHPYLLIWDLTSWQEIGRLEGHAGPVTGVEFAPDGHRALSCSVDGTSILWDVPGRQALQHFGGHGEGLWSLAISPDGRTALSDSGDSSMVQWDLETGQEIRSFMRDDPPVDSGSSGLAFFPDGRTALSCEQDGYLIEWDLETGEEIRRLGQHASLRTRVVISPDGHLALTSGMDGSLRLWDLETGELIRRSDGHGIVFDVALSPDGQTVLFGSSDTTITQWQLQNPSAAELQLWIEDNRYVRELTCEERARYQVEPLCDDDAE